MKIISLVAVIGVALFPAAVSANELLLTAAESKSGVNIISLDLAASQGVGGFEFVVPLPEGISQKRVNLSRCVAELPKNVIAKCDFFGAGIKVAVASTTQGGFASGIVPIGKVTIPNYKGELQVTDVIIVGPDGNEVASSVSSNK
jgi:hypothetical protein